MAYQPKIVTGKVTGTGWPIDGHVLYFSQWDYDKHESYHLYDWDDADDEAVMLTVYQTETEAGLCVCDTLEAFTEMWKAKKWEPAGSFCLDLNQVEVQEVKQEEVKDDTREKLLAHGIDLTPRKTTDKGGILAMPLKANIPDPQRDDWKLVTCPICGAECWENDLARQAMAAEPELRVACTTCALKAGVTAGGKH